MFTGDTVMKVITQHLQAVPVPPSERTELPIPATLEHLVLACLAKKPEERPQNARQLARSLDAIEGMMVEPASPTAGIGTRRDYAMKRRLSVGIDLERAHTSAKQ